jgi:hypothetical protein
MAKLGSSINAALSRISPYAIRAIEQSGAAKGAGYASLGSNLGKSIASVMHQFEEDETDRILQESLMPQEAEMQPTASVIGEFTSPADMQRTPIEGTGYQPYKAIKDSKGDPTSYYQLDEKAIRRFLSDKKVFGSNISEKRIASFLKQESDAINSNNTTQLAFDTFEANKEAQAATIAHRKAVEAARLAEVEKAATLATQRHGELMQKAEQTYQLELKRYNEVIASKTATQKEKEDAAKNKAEAEQKRKTNKGILGTIARQMDETDEAGNPLLSADGYLELADQMEKMVLEGKIIDEGLITFAGSKIIEATRIGQSMQSLAEADAVAADADEPYEVRLENAGNQMRKTLEAQLWPEQLEQYKKYLLDGQETESSRGFLRHLKNQLEAQSGKLRPGSGEEIVRDAIDLYLTTFANPDVSLGNITSYESPEEKRRRWQQLASPSAFSPYGPGLAY